METSAGMSSCPFGCFSFLFFFLFNVYKYPFRHPSIELFTCFLGTGHISITKFATVLPTFRLTLNLVSNLLTRE